MHGDALRTRLGVADLDAGMDLQTLLGERLEGFLRHLLVGHSQEVGHCFQNRNFGAQAAPYTAQLKADDAGADDTQLLGYRSYAQRAVIGKHGGFVELQARQHTGGRTGGYDHVLGDELFFLVAGNLDAPAAIDLAGEGSGTVEIGDLVLFEQVQNAVVVLLYNRVFTTKQRVELQIDALHFNAMLGKVMIDLLEVLGRLQKRL